MKRVLRDLAGHTLTGLYIESNCLHLRMTDRVASLDLESGALDLDRRKLKGSQAAPWVVLPGWLRIINASLEAGRACLDVSGALYSSQIIAKKERDLWHLAFKGGYAAPPMNPRNL